MKKEDKWGENIKQTLRNYQGDCEKEVNIFSFPH